MTSASYQQTQRFVVWCIATLIAAYIAGKVSDAIFKKAT